MKLIEPNKDNNILIIGKREACDAATLLKDLKEKAPNKNFSYMSFSFVDKKFTPVLTFVSDAKEISFANFTYESFFTTVSEETLKVIRQHSDSFEIGISFTILCNSFMDMDTELINKLLEADFNTSVPDFSRKTIRAAGRSVKDTEAFHFKDLHLFDDLIARMTNLKIGTPDELIDLVKFYSRFSR